MDSPGPVRPAVGGVAGESVAGGRLPEGAVVCAVRGGADDPATFTVAPGARVLHEMVRANLRLIPVGCRGGGCGVCRVRVVDGRYATRPMSRRHVTEADEQAGIALACRLIPLTDLLIEGAPGPADPPVTAPVTDP